MVSILQIAILFGIVGGLIVGIVAIVKAIIGKARANKTQGHDK